MYVIVPVLGVNVPVLTNGVPVVPDRVNVYELRSSVAPVFMVITFATVVLPPNVFVPPVETFRLEYESVLSTVCVPFR